MPNQTAQIEDILFKQGNELLKVFPQAGWAWFREANQPAEA